MKVKKIKSRSFKEECNTLLVNHKIILLISAQFNNQLVRVIKLYVSWVIFFSSI